MEPGEGQMGSVGSEDRLDMTIRTGLNTLGVAIACGLLSCLPQMGFFLLAALLIMAASFVTLIVGTASALKMRASPNHSDSTGPVDHLLLGLGVLILTVGLIFLGFLILHAPSFLPIPALVKEIAFGGIGPRQELLTYLIVGAMPLILTGSLLVVTALFRRPNTGLLVDW